MELSADCATSMKSSCPLVQRRLKDKLRSSPYSKKSFGPEVLRLPTSLFKIRNNNWILLSRDLEKLYVISPQDADKICTILWTKYSQKYSNLEGEYITITRFQNGTITQPYSL